MNGKLAYPCSRCGKLIKAGVYCSECQQAIQQATANANRMAKERERFHAGKKKESGKKSTGLNILKILRGK